MRAQCGGVERASRRGRGKVTRGGLAFPPSGQAVDFVTSFLNHGQVSEQAASKVRALAGLAALTVLKSPAEELAVHVNSALNAGASREEILAAIFEASLYSGFDAAHAGLEAALAVLDDAPHAYARAT